MTIFKSIVLYIPKTPCPYVKRKRLFFSLFPVTEDTMVRLLSKFQVVNSEANLFLLVHCSFRQGVTFGEAMSSPLRAYFLKKKYMKWVGVTEDSLIKCLNPKDKLVHQGESVSHLLHDSWKSLFLHMLVGGFKKRFITAYSVRSRLFCRLRI